MSVLDILAEKNILPSNEIVGIESDATQRGMSVEQVLLERGVTINDILDAKGAFYQVPIRQLEAHNVPYDILRYIPEESVRHYKFVPLAVADGMLEVGMIDPNDLAARDALQFISAKINMPFTVFVISESDFNRVLENYKSLSGEVTKALSELDTELSAEEKAVTEALQDGKAQDEQSGAEATKIIEDAPVTKIVATVLRYAIEGGASDVHVEPVEDNVRVRFRVDGALHTSLLLPKKVHSAVVARIKILANMKLDERRKPQDNRFPAHIDGRKIDFRVSTFPTYYGEKVVMRILDSQKGVLKLDDIGISDRNLSLIKQAINRPYGLILISGPTGSGKTTTLYSMLNEIDRDTKNVLSLEDPVEYHVPGMNQSQVRPEIGYTFASGLRTTLRQDPDVIMVGEIRDKETAGLAIQAALTGHLVLSTIHTNTASGVIPRLIDMEVDPYLIPPTLIIAIAQRLVRKLCPDAGEPIPMTESMRRMVEEQFADLPEQYRKEITIGNAFYGVSATKECPKGTRGRQAVFEVLDIDSDVEDVVLHNPVESDIFAAGRKKGMLSLKEDAIIKAMNKEIPFEEINSLGGLEGND